MEADTRLIESMLGWLPMFKINILVLKCHFGRYRRDLGVAVENFGIFTWPTLCSLISIVYYNDFSGRELVTGPAFKE